MNSYLTYTKTAIYFFRGWGDFGAGGIPTSQGTYSYKIIEKYTETDERKEFFGHINLVL